MHKSSKIGSKSSKQRKLKLQTQQRPRITTTTGDNNSNRNNNNLLKKKRHGARPFATASAADATLGFVWPVSKKLEGLVNMELLVTQPTEIIDQIWSDYHASTSTATALSISSQDYTKLLSRGADNAFFIHPIVRDTGYFVMLTQFVDNSFIVTYLEDFKQNPAKAQPYMTITIYDELQHSKDLVLVRSDICALATMNKNDADILTRTVVQSYIDDAMYQNVFNFNKHPDQFNFTDYVNQFTTMNSSTSSSSSNPATDSTSQV